MKVVSAPIEGLLILQPKVFSDERGYFFESYQMQKFADFGINRPFVQDNQSASSYGVIRGLHFQKGKYAQAKLVRVLAGAVYDVAVDLRLDSPTFGQWFGIELSAENKTMFYIPRGFAHGFAALADNTVFFYKCDNYYYPEADAGLLYNDADLNIPWPIPQHQRIISPKDQNLPTLADLKLV